MTVTVDIFSIPMVQEAIFAQKYSRSDHDRRYDYHLHSTEHDAQDAVNIFTVPELANFMLVCHSWASMIRPFLWSFMIFSPIPDPRYAIDESRLKRQPVEDGLPRKQPLPQICERKSKIHRYHHQDPAPPTPCITSNACWIRHLDLDRDDILRILVQFNDTCILLESLLIGQSLIVATKGRKDFDLGILHYDSTPWAMDEKRLSELVRMNHQSLKRLSLVMKPELVNQFSKIGAALFGQTRNDADDVEDYLKRNASIKLQSLEIVGLQFDRDPTFGLQEILRSSAASLEELVIQHCKLKPGFLLGGFGGALFSRLTVLSWILNDNQREGESTTTTLDDFAHILWASASTLQDLGVSVMLADFPVLHRVLSGPPSPSKNVDANLSNEWRSPLAATVTTRATTTPATARIAVLHFTTFRLVFHKNYSSDETHFDALWPILPPLTTLIMRGYRFGPHAAEQFSRSHHHSTLKHLFVDRLRPAEVEYTLCGMANLTSYGASVQDTIPCVSLGSSAESSWDWACTNMENLEIGFMIDHVGAVKDCALSFKKLARLTKLKQLRVGFFSARHHFRRYSKFGKPWEVMAACRELESLTITWEFTKTGIEELDKWARLQWPKAVIKIIVD